MTSLIEHATDPGASQPLGALDSLAETTVIKDGDLFLTAMRDGRLPAGIDHPLGLWWRDCRHLSTHEVALCGELPHLLAASDQVGYSAVHELTNGELKLDDGRILPLHTIQMRIERTVEGRVLEEEIIIRSHHRDTLSLALTVRLGARFEPMLALRGLAPGLKPADVMVEASEAGLVFEAKGADGYTRTTSIGTSPPAAGAETGDGQATLTFAVELRSGEAKRIALRHEVGESNTPAHHRIRPPGGRRRDRPAPVAGVVQISSDDQLFDRILERSMLDLRMLRSTIGGHRFYAAGVPWYATLFGRDSLITALEMVAFDPSIAEDTLRVLAAHLGTRQDDRRDEQPGKVLHELRVGEVAHLGLTPLTRYYGTVDATPLFLCLLADHAAWTGRLDLFHELRPAVDAAVRWIDEFGDLDGDGLLDYKARAPGGLVNQGWKDSWDGILDGAGNPLRAPIALAEAQAYTVRAKRGLAELLDADGDTEGATRLRREAGELSARVERLWVAERGFYAMALDADKRPSSALGSNQGHLMWGSAVAQERAGAIRDALMGQSMFSGWGVRTLAEGEPAYNPVGYHTGSVWPHDNAMIAVGLRNYGYDEDFTKLFEGMLEAASHMQDFRLPELFTGFSRREFERPVPYPVACAPQAWAAGVIPYLLRVGLGLSADALHRRLCIRRPSLPGWLERVEIRDLQVGDSKVHLRFERGSEGVVLSDAQIDGDVEVVLEISTHRPVLGA